MGSLQDLRLRFMYMRNSGERRLGGCARVILVTLTVRSSGLYSMLLGLKIAMVGKHGALLVMESYRRAKGKLPTMGER